MPDLTPEALPAGTFTALPQPTLSGADGLLLRPWRAGDAPAVHRIFRDPLLHRWHLRACADEAEAGRWVEEWRTHWTAGTGAHFAVVGAESGRLLGRVALRGLVLADGAAEVAYWTAAEARGRRVAVRATDALARWALDTIGFQRLELLHSVANEASCRVADRTRFALEGTKRAAGLHQDGWHDMHLHARVRGD
ncbi:GNAT family N-acetyltransferase [Streptomyces sp. NPDC048290]|uniref:GNAT family N-acetyltransferase n=1 Tax=Streptomyces sp. NPDC048290 TaxID=3155811 RepID=UPI003428E9EB